MLSFVFPGQGSQTPGMGRFLVDQFQIAKTTFEEASDAIHLDMKKLCFESSEADLAITKNTQPAIVCTSIAAYRVLKSETSLNEKAVAGHSVGEYAALVAAQAMSFPEAMKAVRLRGQLMQEAVPLGQGGMIAVLGLDETQIRFLCEWAVSESKTGPLSPANFNAPGQIVISGSMKTLDWLKTHFKPEILPGEPKRAKLIPLSVSAPFHCAMMKPAEEKMAEFLKSVRIQQAQCDVVQNVNAKPEKNSESLRKNLIEQISAPVQWTQTMETLKTSGFSHIIECGQGNILRGLFKKFDSEKFQLFGSSNIDEVKRSIELKL